MSTSPIIREAKRRDAKAIASIYRPIVEETAISFELIPPGATEMAARIEKIGTALPWLVCDIGSIVGYAYATQFRERLAYSWSCEVSVYVAQQRRRCGVARGLYTSLLGCLELLGYHIACAAIALPNEASIAFHESMGFTPVGVFTGVGFKGGRWHDVGWWQRPVRENPATDRVPRRASEASGHRRWAEAVALGIPLVRR